MLFRQKKRTEHSYFNVFYLPARVNYLNACSLAYIRSPIKLHSCAGHKLLLILILYKSMAAKGIPTSVSWLRPSNKISWPNGQIDVWCQFILTATPWLWAKWMKYNCLGIKMNYFQSMDIQRIKSEWIDALCFACWLHFCNFRGIEKLAKYLKVLC